ncbi:hypothetical protein SAMN05443637_10731 [Pseudonocardia thermophila]|jgi:Uncharacterized conserved protein|uniref:DUF1684 domain-containing protein n=1 Tax=Pseudonocardia thermophila TaxID=1848 RepID=A0A1M6SY86_PSETH|nr:DUF1684 domain-containing protein [Pseudonocardia thermophila]SHK49653.1 hypothetical protein SAMN05443637_10731 [Pseudonocardia thermophila]
MTTTAGTTAADTTADTTDGQAFAAEWAAWHAAREEELRAPHGWLSLTALHWLDEHATAFPQLPGTWRATGDGGVEISANGELAVGGAPIRGTSRVEPVDGLPGVLVEAGERRVEVIRRTDSYGLRVRDPQAPTRTAFAGVPAFPVDPRWVVRARFTPYPQPKKITVGAVVDGLQHFPTAVGTVAFEIDGQRQELIALAGRDGGLALHFRDATSGVTTYGGGRIVQVGAPDETGYVTVDFNRVVNLPCALTAYATCPLPPEENRLTVAIEAGERS